MTSNETAADFQAEKDLLRSCYAALDAAEGDGITRALQHYTGRDYRWRGFYPFHEQAGAEAVAERFWQPLHEALRHLQRRMDIFIAGRNQVDGFESTWVVSMGHLMGLFDRPWLGIVPTGKLALLRYCEFNRVDDGKITETAMFFDIPHLMVQAGLDPFPPQTAAQLVQPGPVNHDGLLFDEQDPLEGEKTLTAINFMLGELRQWQSFGDETVRQTLIDELRRSWTEDMLWWGPTGIGATYTIERYAQQHAGPFRAGFAERRFNGHVCKLAEGSFGGFFGWPNLTLTPTGGFMGMPGTGKPGDMRVIDMYRRAGDKLAENWIFIDLLHFWNQQGVDILARTTRLGSDK